MFRAKSKDRAPLYRWWTPYLFQLPFFLLFLPFGIGAVAGALGISFADWRIGRGFSFAGLDNYRDAVADPLFRHAMGVTLKLFVFFMVIVIPFALLMAGLLNARGVRFRKTLQLLFFLPVTLSLVAVALVFALLLDGRVGLLTNFSEFLGLGRPPFLTDPDFAPASIVGLRIWRVVGFYTVILYAGLQAIPRDVYEAAVLDGANGRQQFWNITLPLLRPVTLFVCVAASIAAWELFAEPYILTGGGPARSTLTAIIYVYRTAFENFELGVGAAAATCLAAAIIATTLILSWLMKERT